MGKTTLTHTVTAICGIAGLLMLVFLSAGKIDAQPAHQPADMASPPAASDAPLPSDAADADTREPDVDTTLRLRTSFHDPEAPPAELNRGGMILVNPPAQPSRLAPWLYFAGVILLGIAVYLGYRSRATAPSQRKPSEPSASSNRDLP